MAQNIKYENTTIEPTQSAMELSALVQKYGGTRFELRWEEGLLEGVRFAIAHEALGEVPVRLPARIGAVKEKLHEARPYSHRMRRTRDEYEEDMATQAYRIAWRHLKDLCEQLLVATDLGIIEVHEGFLWAVEAEDPDTGEITTLGELLAHHAQAIGSGGVLRLMPGRDAEIVEADYEVSEE